jgi:hypothetical protein
MADSINHIIANTTSIVWIYVGISSAFNGDIDMVSKFQGI